MKKINQNNVIKKLEFGKLLFDAVLCLDANIPQKEIFDLLGKIPIIAADGASVNLLKIGVTPDYIIGDLDTFDSIEQKNIPESCKIIRLPDQETNDFEKILKYTNENNLKKILIVGFHGGDLEHTFNNWSVLIKYVKKLNMCIYDNGRYGIPILESVCFDSQKNEIISLIPQCEAVVTTTNLKWQLNHETISLGKREGARNQALTNLITIELHSGELLLFINNRLPYAPCLT